MFDFLKDTTKKLIKAFNPVDFVREAGSPLASAVKDTIVDAPKDILETGQNIIKAKQRATDRTANLFENTNATPKQREQRVVAEGTFLGAEIVGETFLGLGKALLPETVERVISNKFNQFIEGVVETEVAKEAYKASTDFYESKGEKTQINLLTGGLFGLGIADFLSRGRASKLLSEMRKTSNSKTVEKILIDEFNIPEETAIKYVDDIVRTSDKKSVKASLSDAMYESQARLDARNRGIDIPETTTPDEFKNALRTLEEPDVSKTTNLPETSLIEADRGQLETRRANVELDIPEVAKVDAPVVRSIDDELIDIADDIDNNGDLTKEQLTPELTSESLSSSVKEVLEAQPVNRVEVFNNLPEQNKLAIQRLIQKGDNSIDIETALRNGEVQTSIDTPLPKDTTDFSKDTRLTSIKEQVRNEPLSPDFYEKNIKTSKDSVVKEKLSKVAESTKEGIGKGLTPISTVLENINPELKDSLRKFEFSLGRKLNSRLASIQPFFKVVKTMDKKDRAVFDLARKNGDAKTVQSLIKKYDMGKEYSSYRKTLDNIYEEANKLGMDVGYTDHYAPRQIKDSEGLLDYLYQGDTKGLIDEAIAKKAEATGRPISDFSMEERASIANTLIRGYGTGKVSLRAPGNVKERRIDVIDGELDKFYENSDTALTNYISSMTDNIESRKFFGGALNMKVNADNKVKRLNKQLSNNEDTIKGYKKEIKSLEKEIKNSGDKPTKRLENKIETRKEYISLAEITQKTIKDEIKDFKFEGKKLATDTKLEDNIGAYTARLVAEGKISPTQEIKLHKVLEARFNQKQMGAIGRAYKNMEYISTMGSPLSAITQIGDIFLATVRAGKTSTLKAAFGKKLIKREDVGVEKIAQEFENASWGSQAVDKVFKATGLNRIDRFGKETLLNASLDRLKSDVKKGKKKTIDEIERVFGDDSKQFIDDVNNDVISDDVLYWTYSDLADTQPISLSEMPEAYLRHPNARIFYMLKTYQIKLWDIARREVFREAKTDPVQAAKNMVNLLAVLTIGGATAGEIKDFIKGEEFDPSDSLVDGVLQLAGVNRYTLDQAKREGLGSAALGQILPPASVIDRAGKDILELIDKGEIENGARSSRTVPVVGALWYYWFGRGAKYTESQKEGSSSALPSLPSLPSLPELPKLPSLPKL